MWTDPNLENFYGRVTRIEKAHAKGYGFEARGTLGRSSSWKQERRGLWLVKPLLLVLAVGMALKGAIHHYVGATLYEERVAQMMTGEGFDSVGGTLMQADPVTQTISAFIGEVFPE